MESLLPLDFSLERYNELDYGYAATIHKGQGVTVDRSYVLASGYLDRHATYVSMTRHREGAELYWSREEFHNHSSMVKALSCERVKDSSLDYLSQDKFSYNRGIELTENWVGYESYPMELSKDHGDFSIPKGYEDLFTPDVINKINNSTAINYSDLMLEKPENKHENTSLNSKDDIEFDF